MLPWSFSYNVGGILIGWEVLKMKFIPSAFAFLLIFLSHQSLPCFGSSVILDETLTLDGKSSSSPRMRRKPRPKTIAEPTMLISNSLSFVMSEIGGGKAKTRSFATITSTLNILPREILDNDLRLLLEGKKITLLGREAQLDENSLKFAEDLSKQAEMVAKVNETNLSDGTQRLGRNLSSRRKKVSGKYGVYAETENSLKKKIFLDIVLEIHFSK